MTLDRAVLMFAGFVVLLGLALAVMAVAAALQALTEGLQRRLRT